MGALGYPGYVIDRRPHVSLVPIPCVAVAHTGVQIDLLADLPSQGPWTAWDGYPQQHVQNLHSVFLSRERAWMLGP